MSTHVTRRQLSGLRDGTLPPAEVAEVGRHAASCPSCGAEVAAASRVDRMIRDLRLQLEADGVVEHLAPDVLMSYADGALRGAEREAAADHVADCETCREEVDELRRLQPAIRRRRAWWPYAVAASLALLALLGIVTYRRTPPSAPAPPVTEWRRPAAPQTPPAVPQPSAYGREEWDQLVAEARKARALAIPPVVEALRPPTARFRGAAGETDLELSPNATVVTSTRPRFRWALSEREPSTCNVILQIGDRIVQSGPLTEARWTPPSDLTRGEEYSWQLEVTRGEERTLYPRAPKPPARFRVLGRRAMEEIDAARAQHPGDPLLHAVLLARHGAREDALQSLERFAKSDPELAGALRRSLEKWPR